MRAGDVVKCNKKGNTVYGTQITRRKWRIMMITFEKDEALIVLEKDYDAMHRVVAHLLGTGSMNTIFFTIAEHFDVREYNYFVVHPSHFRVHKVKSSNKDSIKVLQGVPSEYFPNQE